MNILFVTREYPPSPRTGGIGIYTANSAKQLASKGHKVIIVSASDSWFEPSVENDNGITIYRLAYPDYINGRSLHVRLLNRMAGAVFYHNYRKRLSKFVRKIVLEHHVDVVEFPEYGAESLYWYPRTWDLNVKTVIRLHGPSCLNRVTGAPHSLKRKMASEMELLNRADLVTSPSDAMLKWVNKFFPISSRTAVINNFVDTAFWGDIEGASDSRYLFYAGTISEVKGCRLLLEAMDVIKRSHPDLKLILAGRAGAEFDRFRSAFSELFLGGTVKWVGPLQQDKLRFHYHNAVACIFPSYWEPFGLVASEAMASGGLVIGSSSGGMSEIIDEGEDGFLVQSRSVESIVEKINHILSLDQVSQRRIRDAAKLKAFKSFDASMICEAQISLYRSLL